MARTDPAEVLRKEAVRMLQTFEFSEALALLDRAESICRDEALAEMIRLNRATALIELGEDGPEVRELPEVLLRRRSTTHAVLAAHNLQVKCLLANDLEESLRYGRLALRDVEEVGDPVWKASILTDRGGSAMRRSRFEESILHHRRALAALGSGHLLQRAVAIENIGYCLVQVGQARRGIRFIRKALDIFEREGHETYHCETLLDLCNAYLEISDLELARQAGRRCLALADDPRLVRNCHYLLGEVAIRQGRTDEARRHFGVLAAFYPGFVALPQLLLSFDIRNLINLKL